MTTDLVAALELVSTAPLALDLEPLPLLGGCLSLGGVALVVF